MQLLQAAMYINYWAYTTRHTTCGDDPSAFFLTLFEPSLSEMLQMTDSNISLKTDFTSLHRIYFTLRLNHAVFISYLCVFTLTLHTEQGARQPPQIRARLLVLTVRWIMTSIRTHIPKPNFWVKGEKWSSVHFLTHLFEGEITLWIDTA